MIIKHDSDILYLAEYGQTGKLVTFHKLGTSEGPWGFLSSTQPIRSRRYYPLR